jgi:Protein of unknwon function (DUF3008)
LVRRLHTTLPPVGAAKPARGGIFDRALQLESAKVGRMARIFSISGAADYQGTSLPRQQIDNFFAALRKGDLAQGRSTDKGLITRNTALLAKQSGRWSVFLAIFFEQGDGSMPAKSKAQQRAAGIALAVKEHEKPKSSLRGASKSMYGSMSGKELKKMASTSRKGKPEHKGD